ncbi:MAG TPA: ECF-type sigma factor [Gemmataceae bacterium]|jgi:RNA polymerase sigma factor (sigma-70 family)|nr:ECF-type sigma factor [Gemmataceae bacterium]
MSAGESVTRWIDQLKEGDREAVQHLWERYFERLVRQARGWLQHTPRQRADEEDVALAAFASFCLRAEEGRFPRLYDRNDLWQLLVVIAFRKTCNQIVHERRRQPPGGRVINASALAAGPDGDEGALFAEIISREPSPAMAAQTAEECRRLLAELDDEKLRQVALWKMEGHTNEEIGAKLGRSLPTVERKLKRVREHWQKEVTP